MCPYFRSFFLSLLLAPSFGLAAGIDQSAKELLTRVLKDKEPQASTSLKGIDCQVGRDLAQGPRRILQGICFISASKLEEALAIATDSIRTNKSSSDALFLRGLTYSAMNKGALARSDFEEALWFGRHNLIPIDEIYLQLGRVLEETSLPAAARDSYTKGLVSNPKNSSLRAKLATLALRLGDRPASLRITREGLALLGPDVELNLALAEALLAVGERKLHEKDLSEAESISAGMLDHENPVVSNHARLLHVRALMSLEKLEAATLSLAEALKRTPQDAALLALRSQLSIEQAARSAKQIAESQAASEPK